MKTNSEIRQASKAVLEGNWGMAILTTIISTSIGASLSFISNCCAIISGEEFTFLSVILAFLGLFLLQGPLNIGLYNAFNKLRMTGDNNSMIGDLFSCAFNKYGHNVGGYLLMTIFLILWCLLLIVPGIIMAMAYAMVPFILVENPELSAMQAIKKSKAIMNGHKGQLFLMSLGFYGLIILSIFTLFIGLIWLLPFMFNTYAVFYSEVKADYEVKNQQ